MIVVPLIGDFNDGSSDNDSESDFYSDGDR